MDIWIGLLAVAVALLGSFRQAYVKKLTEGHDVLALTYLIMAYATILIVPFFAYSLHNMEGFPAIGAIAFGLLSGIFGIGKTLSAIKALEQTDLSIADPFLKLSPLIVFIGELMVLKLALSSYILLGVLMTVLGSFVVAANSGSLIGILKNPKNKGVKFAILATLFTSASTLSIKFASLSIDPYFLTGLWYISGLLSIAVYLMFKGDIPSVSDHWDRRYPFVGFYSAGLGIMTIYLFSVAPATIISALTQVSVLPSVIIGGKFFSEEDVFRKLIGALLITLGTGILILL